MEIKPNTITDSTLGYYYNPQPCNSSQIKNDKNY